MLLLHKVTAEIIEISLENERETIQDMVISFQQGHSARPQAIADRFTDKIGESRLRWYGHWTCLQKGRRLHRKEGYDAGSMQKKDKEALNPMVTLHNRGYGQH